VLCAYVCASKYFQSHSNAGCNKLQGRKVLLPLVPSKIGMLEFTALTATFCDICLIEALGTVCWGWDIEGVEVLLCLGSAVLAELAAHLWSLGGLVVEALHSSLHK